MVFEFEEEESVRYIYRVHLLVLRKQNLRRAGVQHWEKAMKAEMEALHLNQAWEVVPTLANRNIIHSKWVRWLNRAAMEKSTGTKLDWWRKAFPTNFDENYAPVVRLIYLRLLLALAAHYKWKTPTT